MPSGELWPCLTGSAGPQLTARQGVGVDPARLQDVVLHGAPAQAEQARQLLERYASDGAGPELDAYAEQLVDAYMNDPYLTR